MADYVNLSSPDRSPLDASADPFFQFRDAVSDRIQDMIRVFEAWKDLLQSSDTSTSRDFDAVFDELKQELDDLDKMIKQLTKTVSMVKKNREKFPHIDDAELKSRKKYCNEVRDIVKDVRDTISSPETHDKLKRDRQMRKREIDQQRLGGVQEVKQDGYSSDLRHQQLMMEKEQNVVLDDMITSIQRLGVMGEAIHDELDSQNAMLGDLDNTLDDVQTGMDAAMAKMEKLLQTKSRWKICLILFLILVLVFLIALIIYT